MKVYVLMFGFDYEGVSDVKVFTSKEEANAEALRMSTEEEDEDLDSTSYDYYYVEEKELL